MICREKARVLGEHFGFYARALTDALRKNKQYKHIAINTLGETSVSARESWK